MAQAVYQLSPAQARAFNGPYDRFELARIQMNDSLAVLVTTLEKDPEDILAFQRQGDTFVLVLKTEDGVVNPMDVTHQLQCQPPHNPCTCRFEEPVNEPLAEVPANVVQFPVVATKEPSDVE